MHTMYLHELDHVDFMQQERAATARSLHTAHLRGQRAAQVRSLGRKLRKAATRG